MAAATCDRYRAAFEEAEARREAAAAAAASRGDLLRRATEAADQEASAAADASEARDVAVAYGEALERQVAEAEARAAASERSAADADARCTGRAEIVSSRGRRRQKRTFGSKRGARIKRVG